MNCTPVGVASWPVSGIGFSPCALRDAITAPARPSARFVIAAPEAGSSWSSRITFAPCVRHCSACDLCFWGSAWAFSTVAETPALRNAAFRYGASKSVYRVDDFVSGSSAHAWIAVLRPEAAAASSPTGTRTTIAAAHLRDGFLKFFLLVGGGGTCSRGEARLRGS